ncbi:hypothetical protein D1AOALGA4SA_3735 [Olavius algarvensis Delta 1 endosymbiont]|nr:hypothetical protein D1AOALGA4SA_3735 [Olavius algarvensis Delta 1 endosymbiont]
MVHLGGVREAINDTTCFQVSGVGFQVSAQPPVKNGRFNRIIILK